ncbi:MAG: ATPase domain-containing protein, partial [Candidatus Fermentibacteria bacterium]
MARKRTLFVCNECGGDAAGWSGKCPHCGAWNTMVEEVVVKLPGKPHSGGTISLPVPITEIPEISGERLVTGIEELDRVLGGGVLKGSVNLVGGEPGIGKSTLMLQLSSELAGRGEKVLYATGEESPEQVAQRARRINALQDNVKILAATDLDTVLNNLVNADCSVAVIDSIQTLYSAGLSSAPGSVSQVRHCTSELIRVCKTNGLTAFIVGHVTKT